MNKFLPRKKYYRQLNGNKQIFLCFSNPFHHQHNNKKLTNNSSLKFPECSAKTFFQAKWSEQLSCVLYVESSAPSTDQSKCYQTGSRFTRLLKSEIYFGQFYLQECFSKLYRKIAKICVLYFIETELNLNHFLWFNFLLEGCYHFFQTFWNFSFWLVSRLNRQTSLKIMKT